MSIVTIIGSGMMGSALAFPARENGHEVRLVGTPLDRSKKQPADIPHPYPARPNRTSGRMLGESVGAVTHPTRLPERLRIEGRDIAAQKAYQERKKARAAARRNAAARPAWE